MDEMTITGNLPNMKVEISHRADPAQGAEVMTIHLTATPDFQAALPLLGQMAQMPAMMAPMALWSQALEAWAAPWRQLAQMNPIMRLLLDGDGK